MSICLTGCKGIFKHEREYQFNKLYDKANAVKFEPLADAWLEKKIRIWWMVWASSAAALLSSGGWGMTHIMGKRSEKFKALIEKNGHEKQV
jgi:hypothetical protein